MTAETDLLDFAPCRCGTEDPMAIFVSRAGEPMQMRGELYVVCCRWCGENAPFAFVGIGAEELNQASIAAWNARANLAELQREVEGLRAEVGRLQTKAAGAVDAARGYQRELAAEYARAERLEEALRPLAELDLLPDNLEKAPDWQTIYARNKSEIKVGDVRRARAALDQETTNG